MVGHGIGVLQLALLSAAPLNEGDAPELNLVVRSYQDTVVEKAPLILRIVLENRGDEMLNTYFKRGKSMGNYDLFTLYAVDAQGDRHHLKPLRTLSAHYTRAPGAPFPPGMRLETDHVMCLRSPPGGDEHRAAGEAYFLPPGRYQVYATLRCPPVVQSEPFELTVTQPRGDDARALETFEWLSLYAQGVSRTPRADAKRAHGGTPDEVREKLQYVKEECPDSVFALWLEYWDVFHAMSTKDLEEGARGIERALAFAKEHQSFPLTDNLMFRAAETLVRFEEAPRAREVLDMTISRYPETDISPQEIAGLRHDIAEELLRAKEKEAPAHPESKNKDVEAE